MRFYKLINKAKVRGSTASTTDNTADCRKSKQRHTDRADKRRIPHQRPLPATPPPPMLITPDGVDHILSNQQSLYIQTHN